MASIKSISLALLCAILTACGGGGSQDTPAQAEPAQVPPRVTVGLYGDSIMVGEGAALARDATAYAVTSHAVSGTTLQWAIQARLIESAPEDVVVIAYGTNDALMRAGYYSPTEYGNALRTVTASLLANGKRVVIETPPRVIVDLAPAGRYSNVGADQYADAARSAAADMRVMLCDRNTRAVSADTMPDGVHPVPAVSTENAAALAACIAKAID